MADIAIDIACHGTMHVVAARGGIFWTSPLIGYVIYLDSGSNLSYRKTSDGGGTWAAAIELITGTIMSCDAWADWQTPGDSGTKIHIACIDGTSDEVTYVYLDTSDDSTGTDMIEACQVGTFATFASRADFGISITKAKGGNIAVSFYYKNSVFATFFGFYTSPDGDTWTSRSNPREAPGDHLLLFPGNEADTQDLWAVYWDVSDNDISLKTYDDSGNSWSEQWFVNAQESDSYLQMDGAIRLSDGHLILAHWSIFSSALADLQIWDINGAGSITEKAKVLDNSAETFLTSVFIDQSTDDIYVAYAKGGAVEATVTIYYKKSTDGGGSWGGETAMQANAADDERWISCGAMKKAWGGKFQPAWFNDDLNDLFCNTDNGISIDAALPAAFSTLIPKLQAAGMI